MNVFLYTPRGYAEKTVYKTMDAAVEHLLLDEGFDTLTEFIESIEDDIIDYTVEFDDNHLYIDDGPYIDPVALGEDFNEV